MRPCWGAPAYFFAWLISDFSRYLLSTSTGWRLTDWLFLFYRPPFFVVVWAAKDGIKSPVRTVTSVASKPLLQQQPSRKSSGVSEMCPFILFFLYILQLRCGYCGAVVYVLMKIDPCCCCRCCKDRFPSLPPSILGMASSSSSSRFNVSFVALHVHVTE